MTRDYRWFKSQLCPGHVPCLQTAAMQQTQPCSCPTSTGPTCSREAFGSHRSHGLCHAKCFVTGLALHQAAWFSRPGQWVPYQPPKGPQKLSRRWHTCASMYVCGERLTGLAESSSRPGTAEGLAAQVTASRAGTERALSNPTGPHRLRLTRAPHDVCAWQEVRGRRSKNPHTPGLRSGYGGHRPGTPGFTLGKRVSPWSRDLNPCSLWW